MAQQATKNWGVLVLLCAGSLAWQIYDIATATEASSQALTFVQGSGIVLGLVGLIGGIAMWVKGNAARG